MTRPPGTAAARAAIALLALSPWPAALAETTRCQEITAVPVAITTPGVHCLKRDLSSAVAANAVVRIDASNVTIDCNGHKLGGLAAGDGTEAFGIYALDRRNIVVRNCSIRGFHRGVFLAGDNSAYHLVEDNSLDNNTASAISITGDASIVRRNLVRDTGGSTVTTNISGIQVSGDGAEVIDNTVDGVGAAVGSNGDVLAIRIFSGVGAVVARNRIRNLRPDGVGSSHGISMAASGAAIGNTIAAPAGGAGVAIGVGCPGASTAVRDNALLGYDGQFPLVGCTALDNASD